MSRLVRTEALLLLTLATTIQAATITVDTTEIVIDPLDGACSLPEAIAAANTDTPSGGLPGECVAGMLEDTVVLQPGASYVFTQPFGSGALDVSDTLTISGNGATIARDETAGVFDLIFVDGALLTLQNVIVAEGFVRGIVVVEGSLVAVECVFRDNDRAILSFPGGSVTIIDSTIRNNVSGVSNSGGTLEIEGSTFSNNRSSAISSIDGGGEAANLRIRNSTVSGNGDPALGQQNGGIIALGTGTNRLDNVTVVGNWGSLTGGVYGREARVRNSIVAGNLAADCGFDVRSRGYNIFGLGGGCEANGTTDIEVEPATVLGQVLGPLWPNGGPTFTHALTENSPGIDTAVCDGILGIPVVEDQRGVPRPQDGDGDLIAECDRGAFELEAATDDEDEDGDERGDDPLLDVPPRDLRLGDSAPKRELGGL